MTDSIHLELPHLAEGQSQGEIIHNESLNRVDNVVQCSVKDRNLTAPPGGEANGDRYLVLATGTGVWASHDGEIAAYVDGWIFFTPEEGWRMWVDDENLFLVYDGSNWLEIPVIASDGSLTLGSRELIDDAGFRISTVEAGITASPTQTQGQQPLTKEINQVSVCATVGDVVTLPAAEVGRRCVLFNQTATNMTVFPASGESIDGLSVDQSITFPAYGCKTYDCAVAGEWYS